MRPAVRLPLDTELLDAWSTAEPLEPVARALALLGAFVDAPAEQLERLSPGARDTLLSDGRRALFGAAVELVAACPACGASNSLTVDLTGLPRSDDVAPLLQLGERRFRVPDSRDLAAVAHEPDAQRAARTLAARCALDGGTLDDATLAALDAALGEHDAAAAVELQFACVACGAAAAAPFDAAAVLFADVAARAERLLDDVHRLASAYGWSEAAVLALPAARRERYLARVG